MVCVLVVVPTGVASADIATADSHRYSCKVTSNHLEFDLEVKTIWLSPSYRSTEYDLIRIELAVRNRKGSMYWGHNAKVTLRQVDYWYDSDVVSKNMRFYRDNDRDTKVEGAWSVYEYRVPGAHGKSLFPMIDLSYEAYTPNGTVQGTCSFQPLVF